MPAFGNSPLITTCTANHSWIPSVTTIGCAPCSNSSYTGSYYYCYCDPQNRRPNNVCQPCPARTVPSPNNTQLCTCAPGFTVPTSAALGPVVTGGVAAAVAGRDPSCTPCPTNTFKPGAGVGACTPCPHGSYCGTGDRFVQTMPRETRKAAGGGAVYVPTVTYPSSSFKSSCDVTSHEAPYYLLEPYIGTSRVHIKLLVACSAPSSTLSSCVCGPHFNLDTAAAACVISDDDVYSKGTSADLTFRLLFSTNGSAPGGAFTPASTGVLLPSSAAFGQFRAAVLSNMSLALTLPLVRLLWLTAVPGGGPDSNDPAFVDVTVRITPAAAAFEPGVGSEETQRDLELALRHEQLQDLALLTQAVPPSPMLVGVVAVALMEGSAPSWYTAGVLAHTADQDVVVHAVLGDTTPTLSKLKFAALIGGGVGAIVLVQVLKKLLHEPYLTDAITVVVAWYDLGSTASYVQNLFANSGRLLPDSTAHVLAGTIVVLVAVVYVVNVALLLRSGMIDVGVAGNAKLVTVFIVATSGLAIDSSLVFVSNLFCG